MSVINLHNIESVTLYTGDNSSNFCTCNCPCCSQKKRSYHYQGTKKQITDFFKKLPNLKQLYVLGNPDITNDSDFCHEVIKEAAKRNIHVCFSTSGIGGKKVLIKLLNDFPKNLVDYISFSFDDVTQSGMSFLKGISYPFDYAIEGVKWAIENGFAVKIQPTLWYCNYKNVKNIISFFRNIGVKWFTFHVGSLESNVILPTHMHLTPDQVKFVHTQIDESVDNFPDIKVRCPIIYPSLGNNDPSKWYCMYPERTKELLVTFTKDGIEATPLPIASNYRPDFTFYLGEVADIPALPKHHFCPYSSKISGRNDTCCRYISKYWNYDI